MPGPGPRPLWAVDLETIGTDASHPDGRIVGIGLANDATSLYVGIRNATPDVLSYLRSWLSCVSLVAHNVMFDGTWLRRFTGRWLDWQWCTYGLYKQLATEGHPGQQWGLKRAQIEVLGWPESNDRELKEYMDTHGIRPERMGEVPDEILGPYCALDAQSCLQLARVLLPAAQPFPALARYHQQDFLTEVRLLGEQLVRGMAVDTVKLAAYADALVDRQAEREAEFRTMPTVEPHLRTWSEEQLGTYRTTTPKGRKEIDAFRFNINSKPQLAWLFYEKLGYSIATKTATGRPSVDKKVLPLLGPEGRALVAYNKVIKERGYVEACLDAVRDGLLHPQFRAPGTLTGRLSGSGGFNLQQQPKTRGYLECLVARPGHRMVQLDFAALEPIVLAEASEDPAMMQIYGPDAKPNDIYLFTAAKIKGLGDRILEYYNPDDPTAEGIAAAKKHCKRERGVAKVVQLAKTYNAFPPKIHETLRLGGIDISLRDVESICRQFDDLYAGVQDFKRGLEREWDRRGGWILNGAGRPLPVSPKLKKDLVNRFCQSTGHDFLMRYIWHIDRLRFERGVQMYPLLLDFHDETIWEAPDYAVPAARQVLIDAMVALNGELQMTIPLKGEVAIADNLAAIKCED